MRIRRKYKTRKEKPAGQRRNRPDSCACLNVIQAWRTHTYAGIIKCLLLFTWKYNGKRIMCMTATIKESAIKLWRRMQKCRKEAHFLKSSLKKEIRFFVLREACSLQFNICSSANRHFGRAKVFLGRKKKASSAFTLSLDLLSLAGCKPRNNGVIPALRQIVSFCSSVIPSRTKNDSSV